MKSKLKYIVTGTGRCGTGYLQKTFEESGIRCGHESIFKSNLEEQNKSNYLNNNNYEAESSWVSAPFLDSEWLNKDIIIVHLVRHPLLVIKSFFDINFYTKERANKPLNKLVYKYTSAAEENIDRLESSINHYFEWNNIISKKLNIIRNPSILIKLEEIEDKLDILNSFLDLDLKLYSGIVNDKTTEKQAASSLFDKDYVLEKIHNKYKGYDLYGYL